MTDFLSATERLTTQDLLDSGYANAARSFSAIARQTVVIEALHISISPAMNPGEFPAFDTGRLTVLTTDLFGQLPGKSLLVLTEPECQEIYRLCLPDMLHPNERNKLADALLLEIDNMLAAAVITELANALRVSIYGGVPQLHLTDREGLLASWMMADQAGEQPRYYLRTNARFKVGNSKQLQPYFIWILPEDFLIAIKQLARDRELQSKDK